MFNLFKKIVTSALVWEARLAVRRWKPKIIGITGSVGKSSAKEAIAAVLESRYRVRKSLKSYNSELGLALAVFGLKTAWHNPFGWFKNIICGFQEAFNLHRGKPYETSTQILVLEMGVDRAGDMDRLLRIARPNIGVVTAIGEIPVHVEFFAGPEELALEKSNLIKNLTFGDLAVLNFDDDTVLGMKKNTGAKIVTFGFGSGADIVASNYKISDDGGAGVSFKIEYEGATVPVRLRSAFGKQAVYASLAAVAVGIACDMNLIEISEALSKYKPPTGRLRLLSGIKNSSLLDDSYNASPLATHAALDTLQELAAVRKIVAFGDMLEIGKYTIPAHKAVGEKVAKIADYFIAVGPRSRFAADGAIAQGMDKDRVYCFSTSKEAASFIKSLVQEGDTVLIKGSQSMRMERITEELLANPEEADKILARQDKYWKNKE